MANQEQQKPNQQPADRADAGQHRPQQSEQPRAEQQQQPRGEQPRADQQQQQQQRGRGGPRQLRLQERGREAYQEAQQLASTLEQAVDEIGQFLREQTERRPYVSIATASGIGYVLGGGVPSRLTGFLFGLGSRFAVEMFLRELIGEARSSFRSPASQANRSAS